MPATLTPLRYPGGKTKLYDYVKNLLEYNQLIGCTYVEPFVGGAGLAIKLLLKGTVNQVVINDFDPSIHAFWSAVLGHTDDLCELIDNTEITIEQWHKQKKIYAQQDINNVVSLGFATFFLNRTNISGVIKGGLIGGINQTGRYAMNARFNKVNLIKKIRNIAQHKDQIKLYNLDAKELLSLVSFSDNTFINFDPPYVKKGAQLYKNSFTEEDHSALCDKISACEHKWIVTYDVCSLVEKLYSNFRYGYLDINYSIQANKKAKEYIFFSPNLDIPMDIKNYTGYCEVVA